MLKESTMMKGNLCVYKCFIDVLYIFDRVFKKNWEMRPIWDRWINSIVNFCHVLSWFYLWERIHDPVSVTSIAFNGKLMSFRIKIFKKQFVCLLFSVCSFITLVENMIAASKSLILTCVSSFLFSVLLLASLLRRCQGILYNLYFPVQQLVNFFWKYVLLV